MNEWQVHVVDEFPLSLIEGVRLDAAIPSEGRP